MKTIRTTASLLLAITVLAACSQPSGPADPLASADGAPKAIAPAAAESLTGDGSTAEADFSVEPGKVHACDGRDRVVSTVRWTAKDPAVVTVKVLVGDRSGGEKKVFTAGGNVGEAQTGDWVVDGTRFSLTDGSTGKELASYEVTALPCK